MATSGTVATTVITVDDLINRSLRRCKFKGGEITAEMAQSAKQNLFAITSSLANRGITLWTQRVSLLGLVPNQIEYDMPDGTIDIKNALFRTVTLPSGGTGVSDMGGTVNNAFDYSNVDAVCTQTGPNGRIYYDFTTGVVCPMVGIMANGTATYNLIWEWSNDIANDGWTQVYAPGSASYPDKIVQWASLATPPQARYWSVRESGGATLDVRKVIFARSPQDLPMTRMNRDQYAAQPDKTTASDTITQYFVQRLRTAPQILLWPPYNNYFALLYVWNWRQIQDVGSLTDQLEIPDRWVRSLLWTLAHEMASEWPERVEGDHLAYIARMADKFQIEAETEERDDSPIFFGPNISVYTQ